VTEMNLCPYCGKLAGLVPSAELHTLTLKRCVYCGEKICDVTEALDIIKELTEKLDAATQELWTQSCKLEDVEAFLEDLKGYLDGLT